jgi:hypothetical protein
MGNNFNYFNDLADIIVQHGFTVTPTKGKAPVVSIKSQECSGIASNRHGLMHGPLDCRAAGAQPVGG